MPPKFKQDYVCYYDGQQEKSYFEHFAKLIKKNYTNASIKFNRVENFKTLTKSSTALPRVAVFDYDNDKIEFENKARSRDIKSLYTNLNFDLWILLHKKKYNKVVVNNDDYVDEVRKAYGLDDTADIKKKSVIEIILNQIEIEDIKYAIQNAKKIMQSKIEADKKIINRNFYYYDNPSMNIHEFFEKILNEIEENNKKEV